MYVQYRQYIWWSDVKQQATDMAPNVQFLRRGQHVTLQSTTITISTWIERNTLLHLINYAHYLCRYISLSSQITHLNASGLFPFDAANLFAFRSSETTYMFASVHPPSRHIRCTRSTTWFIIGFPCSRKAWFCSKTYNLLQD